MEARRRPGAEVKPAPRDLSPLLSSATDQWLTPLDFLAVLVRLGPIILDPCGNPLSVVPAARQILLPDDGLTASWPLRGLVFCNPPYGRALGAWARRLAAHAAAGGELVALVPARLDTRWWRALDPLIWCAWSGRLRFLQSSADWLASEGEARARAELGKKRRSERVLPAEVAPGLVEGDAAPFPVAVCYHGPRADRFSACFGGNGLLYKRVSC